MKCNKWKCVGAGILLGMVLSACGLSQETANQEPIEIAPAVFEEPELTPVPEATPTPTPEPTPTPIPEPEETTLTISFAGDFSLGNHHKQDYSYSFNQEYEKQTPAYFLQNVKDIFAEDDMTLVNFEGVLTTKTKCDVNKAYNIKGDPEYVNILPLGNVECVSLANNHALDYGLDGREDTVATLQKAGITYGYEENIGLYEAQGIKVGYVAYTATGNVIPKGLKERVQTGLQQLEEAGADLKIVCLHWGVETKHYPEAVQTTFAHEVIDMGADLLIGHHPHVLQGIEEYNGKFIVYSLGNFCFGANRGPKDMDTVIFQERFTFVDGELQPTRDCNIIPCKISSTDERNNYQPTPATGAVAQRIIDKVNTYSENYGVSFDEYGNLVQEREE